MGFCTVLHVLLSAVLILVASRIVQCQCDDYVSEEKSTCSMLFQSFQSALVGSELNLYNLRKTFSPASHPAPILVNVSYEISIGDVSDDLCPGLDNDSTLFNTSEVQHLSYGWTPAVLYTYYHPAELNRLQPQLVFQFLESLEFEPRNDGRPVATAFTWDGRDSITTAQLSMYISTLPCSPSYEEVYNTLRDITSLLKVYAEIQTNITVWETEDAGYVINGSAFSTDSANWDYGNSTLFTLYFFSFVVSILLASVSTFGVSYVICAKAPKDSNRDEFKTLHSLFWTSVGVMAQFNLTFLLVDISYISIWCASQTGCSTAGVIKLVWFMYTLVFSFMGAIAAARIYQILPDVPFLEVEMEKIPLLFPPFLSPLCFLPFHSRGLSKYVTVIFNIILLMTVFISSSILFFYFLPVLVLLIVYPIKVAAAYSFLIAAMVLYVLIAFYGEYKRVLLPDSKGWNGLYTVYLLCLPMLNIMLIFIILFLYISVYNVISSGFTENPVFTAILSFLPSLILSSFIWIFKRRFQKWHSEQSSEQYDTSHMETTSQDQEKEHNEQEHREAVL